MPAAPKSQGSASSFVSKLVSDPANPPETMIVAGYLGDSSVEGHARLYLVPDLSDYLEIPKDSILHQDKVPGDQLGGVYVWIQRDAKILRKGEEG